MRTAHLVSAVVAAAALVPLSAGAAFAAPPANDMPGGAISLSLGDTFKEDTTKATTGTLDAKVNRFCGAPRTNASVWFTYASSTDGSVILDTSGSDFSAGLMVFNGPPSGRTMISCGPTTLGVDASAGSTYTIMAFSDTNVKGGKLVLSLDKGPPPPRLQVTVDPTGKAFSDGTAKITGTYSCKNGDFIDIYGQLTQIWRRVKITAYFDDFLPGTCDGTVHRWALVLTSDNGLYAKGVATVDAYGTSCGLIDCTDVSRTGQEVTLYKAGAQQATAPNASGASGSAPAGCSSRGATTLYSMSPGCRALAGATPRA